MAFSLPYRKNEAKTPLDIALISEDKNVSNITKIFGRLIVKCCNNVKLDLIVTNTTTVIIYDVDSEILVIDANLHIKTINALFANSKTITDPSPVENDIFIISESYSKNVVCMWNSTI